MKTLVFPDVHNRWRTVQDILDRRSDEVDRIISLGDLIDNFAESKNDVVKTIELLRELLTWPKFKWIGANHDMWYIYNHNRDLRCSGNTQEKADLFKQILGDMRFNYHFYHWDEYFLYSHAGLNPYHLPPEGFSPEWLERRVAKARGNAEGCIYDPLLYAGYSRGGNQVVGGITWQDWNDDFVPIEGVNQVTGHTRGELPRRILAQESVNWCLDTNSRHYAIVEDGRITIYNTKDHSVYE
jgi:hypothetical protein